MPGRSWQAELISGDRPSRGPEPTNRIQLALLLAMPGGPRQDESTAIPC